MFTLPCSNKVKPTAEKKVFEENADYENSLEAASNCLERIPFVNNLYNLFIDDRGSVESVKELLNIISLVDALMLSVAVGLLAGVDFDGVSAADQRFFDKPQDDDFDSIGYYEFQRDTHFDGRHSGRTEILSVGAAFCDSASNASLYLFASLMITVLIYLDIINKDFSADTEKRRKAKIRSWWRGAQICVLGSLGLGIFGMVRVITALYPLVLIKIPDVYVEEHGESSTDNRKSPYGAANIMLYVLVFVPTGMSLIILGISTSCYYISHDYYDEEAKLVRMKEGYLKDSADNWKKFFKDKHYNQGLFSEYCEEYYEMFVREQLDYNDMASITDENLKDIGVALTGHRVKLLKLFAIAAKNVTSVPHKKIEEAVEDFLPTASENRVCSRTDQ